MIDRTLRGLLLAFGTGAVSPTRCSVSMPAAPGVLTATPRIVDSLPETLRFFAQAPGHRRELYPESDSVPMDVLSDVLRVVRLSGALFFTAELSAPWALESPDSHR